MTTPPPPTPLEQAKAAMVRYQHKDFDPTVAKLTSCSARNHVYKCRSRVVVPMVIEETGQEFDAVFVTVLRARRHGNTWKITEADR